MTNAAGKVFISYPRVRLHEAETIVSAMRDHGVPIWQDIADLSEAPTEDEIRRILADPDTASGLLCVTPEVEKSNFIKTIEAPLLLRRARKGDAFFLTPLCAGGLNYEEMTRVLNNQVTSEDLSNWNVLQIKDDPILCPEAANVASRVLKRRVSALNSQLDYGLPIELGLYTRNRPPHHAKHALAIDWSDRLKESEEVSAIWSKYLIPAAKSVAKTILQYGGDRRVMASGLPNIPAALLLGVAFLAQTGVKLSWRQYTPGQQDRYWGIDSPAEVSGFVANTSSDKISGTDLVVLLSVTDDVEAAFARSRALMKIDSRATTHIKHPQTSRFIIDSAGKASHIAQLVVDTIRSARSEYGAFQTVHLFMAIPVGLAVMIGQLLNTLGKVQSYEYIAESGLYRPAALLYPSS